MSTSARQLAHRILENIDSRQQYANLALAKGLAEALLPYNESSLVTDMVMGTTRMKRSLDWLLGAYLRKDVKHLPPGLHNWLRLCIYQLVYMPSLQQHAVVHETVEAIKKRHGNALAGVANGVARAVQRDMGSLPWPKRDEDLVGYLAVVYSYPDWLVDMWLAEATDDGVEGLLEAQNATRPLTLRVNAIRGGREDVLLELEKAGNEPSNGLYAPEALRLRGRIPRVLHDGGRVYVQDESSMLAARALAPVAGQTVIDMCAAPGGKASHIAALMGNSGALYCVENNSARMRLLGDNLARLGVNIATLVEADAGAALDLPQADRILVDAPCSGLGTLYRKADLRWHRREAEIADLAALQKRIVANSWRYLKPGGRLVYSACTISRRETTDVTAWFLAEFADATEIDVRALLGNAELGKAKGSLQLLPHIHKTDGMFVAAFEKRGNG